MKSWMIATLVLGIFGLVGCVQSVQPFVKESQAVYDPGIVGLWSDNEGATVSVTGDAAAKSYKATYTEKDGKVGHFTLLLATIGNQTIVDVTPAELDLDKTADLYIAHFLPLHSVVLLDHDGATLKVRSIQDDWIGGYLKEHPDALPHLTQDKDRIVLTASTDELQKFVIANVNTPKAFGDPGILKRADSSVPPTSSIPAKP